MWGVPSPSQFVTKTEILLKMAGVPYTHTHADFSKTPKGKIPYIEDGDLKLGDSEFIRRHLEARYSADFDHGLTAADKAIGRAFAVMADEHLYWATVNARWMDRANCNRGPRHFFDRVPAPLRPFVIAMVQRNVKRNLYGQGLGRHSKAEIEDLARRDIDAISGYLGDKPFLHGTEPKSADASVWPAVTSVLCAHFTTPLRDYAETKPNLLAYRNRGMALWFPELADAKA